MVTDRWSKYYVIDCKLLRYVRLGAIAVYVLFVMYFIMLWSGHINKLYILLTTWSYRFGNLCHANCRCPHI